MKKSRLVFFTVAMIAFPVISFGQNESDSTLFESPIDVMKEHQRDSVFCTGIKDKEDFLDHPEELPEYPGGSKKMLYFISSNLKFPHETLEAGIVSGRIGISFIVEKDGSITDIQVIRSVEEHYDKAIASIFKTMPKWKPGKNKGKMVRTKMKWFMNYDYR